ncbi:hypothetical protein AB6T38_02995 [Aliiglaciecola sp. SL4]|uniref:hypothetical protein n=1 Tax=Aliiglaciecola sp. SL4 TaxID=3239806 RepID=UPI00355AFAFB
MKTRRFSLLNGFTVLNEDSLCLKQQYLHQRNIYMKVRDVITITGALLLTDS